MGRMPQRRAESNIQSTRAQLLISFCFHLRLLVGLRRRLPPARSLCIYAIVATPENKALHIICSGRH